MKRYSALILCAVLALSLISCDLKHVPFEKENPFLTGRSEETESDKAETTVTAEVTEAVTEVTTEVTTEAEGMSEEEFRALAETLFSSSVEEMNNALSGMSLSVSTEGNNTVIMTYEYTAGEYNAEIAKASIDALDTASFVTVVNALKEMGVVSPKLVIRYCGPDGVAAERIIDENTESVGDVAGMKDLETYVKSQVFLASCEAAKEQSGGVYSDVYGEAVDGDLVFNYVLAEALDEEQAAAVDQSFRASMDAQPEATGAAISLVQLLSDREDAGVIYRILNPDGSVVSEAVYR